MDTVVSTFTLCTIPGVVDAIRGIGRVLRSSGTLIFFELMRSPDPAVRRRQQRWEPLHHRVYASLYPTRDMPVLLPEVGLRLARMDTAHLARFPKSWTYCWSGIALPDTH